MTTASTSTPVNNTTTAGFQTWVQEIITMLVTTLGVTQTADTGQINTGTVALPGTTNATAGYAIFRFNDAAQATSPIFFKLEFGTGNPVNAPAIRITVGTGSNGAGTITGVVMTRVAVAYDQGSGPASITVPYITRACYNTTDGVLWLAWKLGGNGATNATIGGFAILRSHDANGAVTTDAVALVTNATTTSGVSTTGYMQVISYLTNTLALGPNAYWGFFPFNTGATLYSGNAQVLPCFQYTPVYGISNWMALAYVGELGVGATVSLTILGATPHTYVSAGSPFGTNTLTQTGYTANGGAANSATVLLPWE